MTDKNFQLFNKLDFALMALILEEIASARYSIAIASVSLNVNELTINYAREMAEFLGKELEPDEKLKQYDEVVLPVSSIAGCLVGKFRAMKDHDEFMGFLASVNEERTTSFFDLKVPPRDD